MTGFGLSVTGIDRRRQFGHVLSIDLESAAAFVAIQLQVAAATFAVVESVQHSSTATDDSNTFGWTAHH